MKYLVISVLLQFLISYNGALQAQWVQTNGPYGGNVNCLTVSGTNILAGTEGGGVFLSTNNGTNWIATGLQDTIVSAFAVNGTNLFAGTPYGVFLSTNNGTSWTDLNSGFSNNNVHAFAVSGTNLFAGTYGGVYRSTNNGINWTAVNNGLTNPVVIAFVVSGTHLFAGTFSSGVFHSTNNGTSWIAVISGLAGNHVPSLAVNGTNLFAGTGAGDVWRRTLSEMITSVERLSTDVPTHFSLEQNYPNPFNPSTTIKYQIPRSGLVNLKVYDILGNEVSTLVNENKIGGFFEVNFDASKLANGIYIYQLKINDFVSSKKMLLLK